MADDLPPDPPPDEDRREAHNAWHQAALARLDALLASQNESIARLDKLLARLDLKRRLERGEDGFDAY